MNRFYIALLVAVYVEIIHLTARYLKQKKGIPYGKTVFWSLLISPLLAYLFLRVSSKNNTANI